MFIIISIMLATCSWTFRDKWKGFQNKTDIKNKKERIIGNSWDRQNETSVFSSNFGQEVDFEKDTNILNCWRT